MRRKGAHGQCNQDRRIIATCGYQNVLSFADADGLQRLIARRIGGHDVAAQGFCLVKPFLAWIDNDDAGRVGSTLDQFTDRFGTGNAVAEHHDVVGKLFLNAGHAPFLPAALDDEIVGRTHKNEENREANWRDDHRLDQPRAIRNGGDVAKTGRGNGDHREIDDVEKAYLAVEIVDQPFTVPPVDHDDYEDEEQRETEADTKVPPHRYL